MIYQRLFVGLLIAFLLCAAPFSVFAQQQAFQAMDSLRSVRGPQSLDSLVEVRGVRGGPEPDIWVFLLNDPSARGGIREITVQRGQVVSERTPLRGFSGIGDLPAIPATRLKIDSRAAFQIANREAAKKQMGFHWLDYTLRSDAELGVPIWVLDLIDYLGVPVGSLTLSAETGTVLRALTPSPDSFAQTATTYPTKISDEQNDGGVIGKVQRTREKVTNSVRRGALDVIGAVEEWLTGERTIGMEE